MVTDDNNSFKLLLIYYTIALQPLNRQETEDLILDLYYNQKKTFRKIQKIVRKSPRDIRAILDKVEPERTSLSSSSRAYRMFKEGYDLIDVATILNLREKEVSEYYREYWNLIDMYNLNQMYEEIKEEGILSIIELHRRMKTDCLSIEQISSILKRNIKLERQNMDLEGEQARLEVSNKQAKTFQQFTDHIQEDHNTIEANNYIISQQKREIEKLNIEKERLENTIDSIQLNNKTIIKIKQIVKQEIGCIIPNPRKLLRLALASLFESSRKHPGKFQTMYYNMPSHLSVEQILSESSINQNASSYRYIVNEDEKILIDEAEQSYNRIINAITNYCINEMQNDTGSSLKILQVPNLNNSRLPSVADTHKIIDTIDLSQINLTYNNIIFQVYPDSEFTNKLNTKKVFEPEKIKIDRYNFVQE